MSSIENKTEIKYIYNMPTVNVIKIPVGAVKDVLDPAVYEVAESLSGFYLKHISGKFDIAEKQYGSTPARAKRIVKSFQNTDKSFGVLATGFKGIGKTELIKSTANLALEEMKIPIIVINEPYSSNSFMEFMNNIGNCVIVVDEFGKKYKTTKGDNGEITENPQEQLLTFFDGLKSTKRLILLTENEKSLINNYMLNRPSRIWYHFEYTKIEKEVIEEYAAEFGAVISRDFIDSMLMARDTSRQFSFDVMQALIREKCLFPEDSFEDLVEILNVEIQDPDLTVVDLELNSWLLDEKILVTGKKETIYNYKNNIPHIDSLSAIKFNLHPSLYSKFDDEYDAASFVHKVMQVGDNVDAVKEMVEDLTKEYEHKEEQLRDFKYMSGYNIYMDKRSFVASKDSRVMHAGKGWTLKGTVKADEPKMYAL